FGGDVKVSPDKENNSLIITASKQDYEVVRSILAKIDIPRDQVFVKAVIMEMNADDSTNWGINVYKFQTGTNGAGRAGFSSEPVSGLLDPSNDNGLVLGYGSGDTVDIKVGGATVSGIPSLLGLIKFIKAHKDGNVLSTPQITALDNEEAMIEVGENVAVSGTTTTTATGTTSSVERKDLTLKLKLTPYISPDTDSVRMKIDQKILQLSNNLSAGGDISKTPLSYSTRTIETNIVVNSNDTAILGGLMEDVERESISKVPVLGDIPIIGWLFKSKRLEKQKKNLLIFITPKIVRNSQDNTDLVNSKLNDRIDFVQQNMKGKDPHGAEVDRLPRRAMNDSETKEFIDNDKNSIEKSQIPKNSDSPEAPENAPQVNPGEIEEGD
ncbi:MAG: secretin N-terminal domain-containing protein, partial [Bdellovibrionales bacterium]